MVKSVSNINKKITIKERFVGLTLPVKLAITGVFILILWLSWGKYQTSIQSKVNYQTSKAEKGTLVVSVSASGTVASSNITTISSAASGVVKKVYVKDGDKLVKGQKIAEIELDQEGLAQRASSYSSYISALNSLGSANNSYRSTQASLQKVYEDIRGHDSDETLTMKETRTKAEVANDNAYDSVNSAKAKLSSAWLDYQLTSPMITASSSGIISSLTIAEGLSLNSQTSTGETSTGHRIASIIKDGNPIVAVSLNEIDVPNVQIGQSATITFDSIVNKTFSGKVVSVDRIGSVLSNVTSYPVLIKLDSGSNQILPNMAVTAGIITQVKDNVLLIPSASVSQQGEQYVVRVMRNGSLSSVNVEIGLSSVTQTEIVTGVNEGDEVVTGSVSSQQNTGGQTRSVFSTGGLGGAGRALGR